MGGYAGLGIIVCLSPYDGLGRMTEGILTRLADKGGREVWWMLLLFMAGNSKE